MAEIMHAKIKLGTAEVPGYIVLLHGRTDSEAAETWDMPVVKGISVRRADNVGDSRKVNAVVKAFDENSIVPFEGKGEAENILKKLK